MKKLILFSFLLLITEYNAQWEYLNEAYNGQILSFDFVDDYAGWISIDNIILRSKDTGNNWIEVQQFEGPVKIDFIDDQSGWAISGQCAFQSSNGGSSWIQKQQFASNIQSFFAVDQNTVFVGTNDHVFKTTNGGDDWINIYSFSGDNREIRTMSFSNSEMGIVSYWRKSSDWAIIKTTDGGDTWTIKCSDTLSITQIEFTTDSSAYFLANNKVFMTKDFFESWTLLRQNVEGISCFYYAKNNKLYLCEEDSTDDKIITLSIDGGITWNFIRRINNLGIISNIALYVSNLGDFYLSYGYPVGRRSSSGAVFCKGNSLSDEWEVQFFCFNYINDMVLMKENRILLFSGLRGLHSPIEGYIFNTYDQGETWKVNFLGYDIINNCFLVDDTTLFIVCGPIYSSIGGHIYKSSNLGEEWSVEYENNYDSTGYEFWGNDICFIDEYRGWAVGSSQTNNLSGAGILGTVDGGETWNLNNQYNFEQLNSISAINNKCWAVGDEGSVFKYTVDNGWELDTVLTTLPLNKVYFINETCGLIAGGYSNNNGFISKFWRTTDFGENWATGGNLNDILIRDIAFFDSDLGFIVGEGESDINKGFIKRSTDGGLTWEVSFTSEANEAFVSISISDSSVWVAGELGTVIRSNNLGVTWVDDRRKKNIINEFSLEQNYPNPFNPKTSIEYQVKSIKKVNLKVFELLGKEVATLVNEIKSPGAYEVGFDASNLTSGVYFYRFQAGDFVETKKMLLLK